MDADIATPTSDQPVRGYQRAAVDEFLAAAQAERSRLETLIAEANDRTARARAAVGMHHIMVAMLVETQEELARRRREADQEAASIIADAEAQARAIESPPTAPEPLPPAAVFPAPPIAERPRIHATEATSEPPSSAPRLQVDGHNGHDGNDDGEGDRFFAFLRQALSDEEPLGPRPEKSA
jgi:hypothetical protein